MTSVSPGEPLAGDSGVTVTLGSLIAGATATVFPGRIALLSSRTVTKIDETVVPSATTDAGWMVTEDLVADTVAPTWNVTWAVWEMVTLSVLSAAVKVTVSAAVSVTWNTTLPVASVTAPPAETGVAAAVTLGEVSVTVFPATGLAPPVVRRVTVTVVPCVGPTEAVD